MSLFLCSEEAISLVKRSADHALRNAGAPYQSNSSCQQVLMHQLSVLGQVGRLASKEGKSRLLVVDVLRDVNIDLDSGVLKSVLQFSLPPLVVYLTLTAPANVFSLSGGSLCPSHAAEREQTSHDTPDSA
jgi:hypothetical protein